MGARDKGHYSKDEGIGWRPSVELGHERSEEEAAPPAPLMPLRPPTPEEEPREELPDFQPTTVQFPRSPVAIKASDEGDTVANVDAVKTHVKAEENGSSGIKNASAAALAIWELLK